jgi:hypothetical protein
MYDDGAKGYMNGIAIHPYPNSIDWWYTYKAISLTTQVRDENGDSVPLWIDEIGMSTTDGWSTTQQSEVDSNVIRPLLAYPGIAGVYINQLIDSTTGPYVNEGFGVMTSKFTPKPAFCAIAKMFATGYKCPVTVAQPVPSSTQDKRWQAENLLQYGANAALSWHAAKGSYTGLTSAGLHAIDSRISATAPSGSVPAGSGADPSEIGVYVFGPGSLLLCNTSQADLSYCIFNTKPGDWVYGDSSGSIDDAASAVIHARSNTW